jgi:CelD/BcsL family acetyltransferase involved in cellulose biosynthesis
VLDYVDADTGWPAALAAASPRPLVGTVQREAVLPLVELDGLESWDAFLASRSRNMRSQLRRYERAIEREHAVAFRRTERQEELGRDLETFFRLHYARWSDRGGSTSAGERARAFHADFAAAALERGWLRLWFLELDGEPAASWYGWSLGGVYSYYLAGFDPARERLRPGHVLLAHTLREAIAEGAHTYDMLLGDEEYKRRLASSERAVRTTTLVRARHPARLLVSAEGAMRRASRRLSPSARRRLGRALGALEALTSGGRRR